MTSFENSKCGNIHFNMGINGGFTNKERHYPLNEYFNRMLYGKAPIKFKKAKKTVLMEPLKEEDGSQVVDHVILHKNRKEIIQAIVKSEAFFADFVANVTASMDDCFLEVARVGNELLVSYRPTSVSKSSMETKLLAFLDSRYSSFKVETTFEAAVGYPSREFTKIFAQDLKKFLNDYFEVEVEDFYFREIFRAFKYTERVLNVFQAVAATELFCYFRNEIPLRENLHTHNVSRTVKLRKEFYSFFKHDFHWNRIVDLFEKSSEEHKVKIDEEALSIDIHGPLVDVVYLDSYITYFSEKLIFSQILYNRTVLTPTDIKEFFPQIFKYKVKYEAICMNIEMNGKKVTLFSMNEKALSPAVAELNQLFEYPEYEEYKFADEIYALYLRQFRHTVAERFPCIYIQFSGDDDEKEDEVVIVGPGEDVQKFISWLEKELKFSTLDGYLMVQFEKKVKINKLLTQVNGTYVKILGDENAFNLFMSQYEMYRVVEQTRLLQQPQYSKGNVCKTLSLFDIPELGVLFLCEPMFFDYFKRKITEKCPNAVTAFEICRSSNQLAFYCKSTDSEETIIEEICNFLQNEVSYDKFYFSQICQELARNDIDILKKFINKINDLIISKEIDIGHKLAVKVEMSASNGLNVMGLRKHYGLVCEEILFKQTERMKFNLDLLPILHTEILKQLMKYFSEKNSEKDDDVILEVEDDCVYFTGSFYFYIFFSVYFEKHLMSYEMPNDAFKFEVNEFGRIFHRSEKLFNELCKEFNRMYAGTSCELSVHSDFITVRPPLNIVVNPLGVDIEDTYRVTLETFITSRLKMVEVPFFLEENDALMNIYEEMVISEIRHLAKKSHKPLLVHAAKTEDGAMLIYGTIEDVDYVIAELTTETERFKIGSDQPASAATVTLMNSYVEESEGELSFSFNESMNLYCFKGPLIDVILLEMLIEFETHGLFPRVDITRSIGLVCTRYSDCQAFKKDLATELGCKVFVNLGKGHLLLNKKVTSDINACETAMNGSVSCLHKKYLNLQHVRFSLPKSYLPNVKSEFLTKCYFHCVDIEMDSEENGRFVIHSERPLAKRDENMRTAFKISYAKKFGSFCLTRLNYLEDFMLAVNKITDQLMELESGRMYEDPTQSKFNLKASEYDALYILLYIENLVRNVRVAIYEIEKDVFEGLMYRHLSQFIQTQENKLVKVGIEYQKRCMLIYTMDDEILKQLHAEINNFISNFERFCD